MKSRYALLIFLVIALVSPYVFAADELSKPQIPSAEKVSPVSPLEEPTAPELKDQNEFFQQFLHMLTTLGIIVVVLLLLSWFVKRMLNTRVQQLNSSSLIKIVERRSLSPKAQVYVVEIYGKTLVLGESHMGLTKIAEIQESGETPFEQGET